MKRKPPTHARVRAAVKLLLSIGKMADPGTTISMACIVGMAALEWSIGDNDSFEDLLLSLGAICEEAGGLYSNNTGCKIDIAQALATGKYPK